MAILVDKYGMVQNKVYSNFESVYLLLDISYEPYEYYLHNQKDNRERFSEIFWYYRNASYSHSLKELMYSVCQKDCYIKLCLVTWLK